MLFEGCTTQASRCCCALVLFPYVSDKVFKTLMATVTTQWEDANAFKSLKEYSPASGALRIPEVAPEDFETPADNWGTTTLQYSPRLLSQAPTSSTG